MSTNWFEFNTLLATTILYKSKAMYSYGNATQSHNTTTSKKKKNCYQYHRGGGVRKKHKIWLLHEHVRMQVIIKYLGMYCDYLLYEKYMIYGYLIQNKSKKVASHQGLWETEASTSSATSYLSTVFDRKALSRSDISGSDGPSNHSRRAARKHWAEFFGWSLSIAFME